MTRTDLQASGFLAMFANGDLLAYGYQIRHWFNPRSKEVAIEFIPRHTGCGPRAPAGAKAVVVTTYAEQAEFHRQIGAQVVPAGEVYDELGQGVSQEWLY